MPTPFQEQVYAACRSIPKGKVTTYGRLGRLIGCRSARAIGQALRNNPYAPHTPCHRVVATDLRMGGFNGEKAGPEIQRKIALLEAEGVLVLDEKRIDPSCLWLFDEKR